MCSDTANFTAATRPCLDCHIALKRRSVTLFDSFLLQLQILLVLFLMLSPIELTISHHFLVVVKGHRVK